MAKSEKIKSLMGPGGLRCDCCGRQAGRRGKTQKRVGRKVVRNARKNDKRRAIREGKEAL